MTPAQQIILVDPAEEGTSVLGGRLRMQGYTVHEVADPAEGARMALADAPAAVIADLWMPGISGVQLCRLLKAEAGTEHVPVVLRGPDSQRNRFWAERAGAAAYIVKGRMGDLVRALARAIANTPPTDGFCIQLAGDADLRDRIASHLDAALFESVIAAEVRALGTCGAFDRLFDLFSQLVTQITTYRWLAVSTVMPSRFALHTHPRCRAETDREARTALGLSDETMLCIVEDEDTSEVIEGPTPIIYPIVLGGTLIGKIALAPSDDDRHARQLVNVLAREVAGPIRMASLVEESQRLATIDPLTGLMNRRAFLQALDVEFASAARYGQSLTGIVMDLDHFKVINDRHGHASGDTVLSTTGAMLAKQARKGDLIARWGGEEFVLALRSTDLAGAAHAAERLRKMVSALGVTTPQGEPIVTTVSIGAAQAMPGESIESLIDRADRAMYQAKSGGRNRVVISSEATQPAEAAPGSAAPAAASEASANESASSDVSNGRGSAPGDGASARN
ncbi:MAG TPA: diguanylate cyclase [Polyangiaceae bacterium]|nr:diguanylate cyclase [Polyangiaceae bacterium]